MGRTILKRGGPHGSPTLVAACGAVPWRSACSPGGLVACVCVCVVGAIFSLQSLLKVRDSSQLQECSWYCWSQPGGGGGGWHKASVLGWLPLAAPIGLSPLLILTLCGPERVSVVSTEPPDDLSCLTTPGVGRPGDGAVARAVDQGHPEAHSQSMRGFANSSTDMCAGVCICSIMFLTGASNNHNEPSPPPPNTPVRSSTRRIPTGRGQGCMRRGGEVPPPTPLQGSQPMPSP